MVGAWGECFVGDRPRWRFGLVGVVESIQMPVAGIKPSQRVRVIQTIRMREGDWHSGVEGEVVSVASKPTGSWFAHGKDDKLWLTRLRIRKDDGELVDLVLDRDSVVTVLDDTSTTEDGE